jgi:hypothetical protein
VICPRRSAGFVVSVLPAALCSGVLPVAVALFLASCGGRQPSAPTSPTPTPAPSVPTPSPPSPTVMSVSVTSVPAPAYPGQSMQLMARAAFSNGTSQDVTSQATWDSSNAVVATVSSTGLLSTAGIGSADIRATYQGITGSAQVTVVPSIGDTPTYSTYRPLMEQVVRIGPVYVTSGRAVPLSALEAAGGMLRTMLLNRYDIGAILRNVGALTAVFSRTETSCNLPYFSDLTGTASCTQGGLGGVPGRPATACAERNLLRQPDDPFRRGRSDGENVCVHELAHTIMNVGLTNEDRSRIRARYQAARNEGIWSGDYAMENADEFFAEMAQAYFCANPDVSTFQHRHGINCAAKLRAYDSSTFTLVDGIFRGSADLR